MSTPFFPIDPQLMDAPITPRPSYVAGRPPLDPLSNGAHRDLQRPARMAGAVRAAKEKRDEMDRRVEDVRSLIQKTIAAISEEYDLPLAKVSQRVFGSFTPAKRKVNTFNVVMKDKARRAKEAHADGAATGAGPSGREVLPTLAREASSSYKDGYTRQELAKLVEEHEREKDTAAAGTAPSMRKAGASAAKDTTETVNAVAEKLAGMHGRTAAEYLLIVTKKVASDSFAPHVYSSSQMKDGAELLFANSLETTSLRLEGYNVLGIPGLAKHVGGKKGINEMKAQLRHRLLTNLQAQMQARGAPSSELPKSVPFARYLKEVEIKHGLRIESWPADLWQGSGLVNPSNVKRADQLAPLWAAVVGGGCHFRLLTDEEWDEVCRANRVPRPALGSAAQAKPAPKKRKAAPTTADGGKKNGARKAKATTRGKGPTSAPTVESDDDDDDSAGDDDPEDA